MDLRRQLEARDPAAAGPTAGALVAVGAAVTAVTAAAGPRPQALTDVVVAVVVPAVILVTGVLLLGVRGRGPSPRSTVLLLAGLLALAGLDVATGGGAVSGRIFLGCAVLYAASQLRTAAAVVTTVAAVAVDVVVAIDRTPPGQAPTDALAMTATLVAIAAVVIRTGLHRDAIIGELQDGKAALTEQATHDALTGLPNRLLFHRRVQEALTVRAVPASATGPAGDQRTAHGGEIAVLFCDLDGFKAVNDSLGHRAGDELLVAVGHRLRSRLRGDDVVARLGGDEFAVLVHDTDRRSALAVADRLRSAFTDAFPVAGRRVHVAVSIGVTLAAPGAPVDVDALVREADVAMYEAKGAGRGGCVVFTPEMLAAQVERASLSQDLHGAVDRGEIFVLYQPVVDLLGGRVDGLEALARWAHPTRGLISPATFIPLAEDAGLIDEIGCFVLAEVGRHAPSFADAAGRQISVGVNVSASQLTSGSILDHVTTGRTRAMQLLVEVTEGTLLRPDVVPVLEELRRRRVRIAMDDFGVGHSSIAALRLIPVDAIKLDRAFTVDVSTDPRAAAIVRAVSTMARELDLSLIAEGIETTEQRDALTGIGCRYGQGYLMARPMSARSLCDHLRERRDRATPEWAAAALPVLAT